MSDVQQWLARVSSPELMERVEAAENLASLSKLSDMHHQEAISALQTLFEDEEAEVRQHAFYGLIQRGESPLSLYQKASQDSDYLVRTAAAEMLGQVKVNDLASEVLIGLLKDPYYSVRATAAEALGQQEAFLAIPALQDALLDSDQWVRYSAAESLSQIESDNNVWEHIMVLHSTLDSADPRYREALQHLKESNDRRIIPTLLFLFKQKSTPQPEILDVLTSFRDYLVVPTLIDIALFTESPSMRETALLAAQSLSTQETLNALKSWIDPDYLDYAQRAVELLAQLPMPKEVAQVLKEALSLPDQWIRTVALSTLEKQGAAADSKVLSVLIKDPSPDLAAAALLNLSRHYPEQLFRHAKSFAQSKTSWKEEALAVALRYAPQSLVREMAPALMESPHATTRESLCKSLKYHGSSFQDLLLTALKDKEHWVRQEAVDALSLSIQPKVTEALIYHLGKDEDFMVRAVAAQALEKHPDTPEHTPSKALWQAATQDSSASVRLQAVRSILTQHEPTIKQLEKLFKISDKSVQLTLLNALSKQPALPDSSLIREHIQKTSHSSDLQLASAAQQLLAPHHAAANPAAE
jgi:HEAT repeat protein